MSAERLDNLRVFVIDSEPVYRRGIRAILEPRYQIEDTVGTPINSVLKTAAQFRPSTIIMGRLPTLGQRLGLMEELKNTVGSSMLAVVDSDEQNYFIRRASRFTKGFVRRDCQPEVLTSAVNNVSLGQSFIDQDLTEVFIGILNNPKLEEDEMSIREREVLELIAQGQGTRQIAKQLCLSIKTVETHIRNLAEHIRETDGFADEDMSSRNLVVVYAARRGMIKKLE